MFLLLIIHLCSCTYPFKEVLNSTPPLPIVVTQPIYTYWFRKGIFNGRRSILLVNCNTSGQRGSDLEEAAARKRHRRTNERKKGIIFHLDKILYLLYAGRKDLKWSLIPGSNSGRREPSFSRGFNLQRCSGFKPSAYEDPNMVTKCLCRKHNYT